MIQAFFFDLQAVNSGAAAGRRTSRDAEVKKVGVLGAGMMGAGIAYVCAKAGIEVVLKDVSHRGRREGQGATRRSSSPRRSRAARPPRRRRDALLARITADRRPGRRRGRRPRDRGGLRGPELKAQGVRGDRADIVEPDALLGSNTSTLPITGLAEGVTRPADFIGLHFFSPVDKMPLLEIIKGEQTVDETLARALDFAKQIGKTPIVVNDSRGFFTSRVIGTFINEGIAMLAEGVGRRTDRAGRLAGRLPGAAAAAVATSST